jgi:uncharacterized protein (PEP-CTERM system associated)
MARTATEQLRGFRGAAGVSLRPTAIRRKVGSGNREQRGALPTTVLRTSVLLLCAAFPAHAETWQITPLIAVNETLSDNVFLRPTNRTRDLITSITPGISIDGAGARSKLRLNYSLTQNLYAREASSNNHQNSLSAIGMVEAIEDWLFIDATGTISQQYLTPLGPVSPSNASINSNQTETSAYALSPYIRGRLFASTEYLLRYKAGITSSQSGQGDLRSSEWQGKVSGDTRWGPLGWAVNASRTSTDYARGRDLDATRYDLTLLYRINPQWQILLSNGRETNNYVSAQQESNNTGAYGFVWTPDPRTKLSASKTKRFFGDGYEVELSHRMPRSLWTYRASRDVSFQPAGATNTGQGSYYDAFYALIAANNPGLSRDAIRAQVVQFLQSRGLPVDGTVVNGYLTNTATLRQQQQLSVALLGVRNTVTLTASDSKLQPLDLVNGSTGDFSTPEQTRQRGLSLSWGHQLTGLTSLSAVLTHQRATSFAAGSPESKTQAGYLFATTRISPKTSVSVGLRRVVSTGANSYTEDALTGAFSHSF